MSAGSGKGLSIRGVVKRYGDFTAVDRVDLDIRTGEFLTFLGPSGSGKTTLLMMIAGFQDVTEGDILLDGQSIAPLPAEKRNLGMVFQGYALFPHMTVRQNIAYPLEIRRRARAEINRRVDEMLDLVQLAPFGDRKPAQLSGGQQQRVALARALSFAPPILLLDEPLGALDRKLRGDVQAQLKEIHRRIGTTFVYVTHDQEEALSMSDRVVIMQSGRIEQVGTPQELYQKPETEFSAGFLGNSNFLTIDGIAHALRPERIDIASKGARPEPRMAGKVVSMTYLGSVLRYAIDVPDAGIMEADVDAWRGGEALPEGSDVELFWPDEALVRLRSP
ncbi:MAG: ABC transporter ATP-binding protein [Rhodobacteraceae bacterium]|nr:ABC transporter ATP-binding protein [Paracoccaceae bacterium]